MEKSAFEAYEEAMQSAQHGDANDAISNDTAPETEENIDATTEQESEEVDATNEQTESDIDATTEQESEEVDTTEQESSTHDYANERSEQIDNWLRANPNLDIEEAIFWNDLDVETLEDDDLIYMALSEQNPDKSDEHIQLMHDELTEKYNVLYESEESIREMIEDENNPLTQTQYRKLWLEHEDLMSGYKKTIEDVKNELQLDLAPTETEDSTQGLTEEQLQSYHSTVDDSIKDFSEMQISFGDGESATFKVDEEMRNAVSETMKNPDTFWSNYVDPKTGATKLDKLQEDLLWLSQKDNILKTLTNQAKTTATEQQIKKDANINFDKTSTTASPKTQSAYEAYMQAAEAKNR